MNNENSNSTILVIDDDQDTLQIIEETLKLEFRARIVTATNPRIMLEKIRTDTKDGRHNIDVIVLDIKMPEMSGHEFLLEIRSMGIDVPVVFLSGFAASEQAIQAMQLGAFDLLLKPFTPEVLLNTVNIAKNVGKRRRRVLELMDQIHELGNNSGLPEPYRGQCRQYIEEIRKEMRMMSLLELRNSNIRR